jgi:predicted AAA+ superfamily ATPase
MPELDLLYGSSGDKEKDLATFKTNFEQLRSYVQAFYEASVNWSEEHGYLKESYDRYHHIVETFKNAAQELNENMLLRSFMTSLDMVVWDKMLDNHVYELEPTAVIDDVFKKLLASSMPEQQDTQLNRGM